MGDPESHREAVPDVDQPDGDREFPYDLGCEEMRGKVRHSPRLGCQSQRLLVTISTHSRSARSRAEKIDASCQTLTWAIHCST